MAKRNTYLSYVLFILLAVILLWISSNRYELFNNFVNENNTIIDTSVNETEEQDHAEKYIQADSVVLELGGRYGTVSAVINNKLSNRLNHVVVEPDQTVWNALEKNKINTGSQFHILRGFISNKRLSLEGDGYAITQKDDENSSIPSYTLDEIEKMYNLKFNTLVADCEGCLETFFDQNPLIYKDLNLILMEADYPNKCNYEKIKNNLRTYSFREISSNDDAFHTVWVKNI